MSLNEMHNWFGAVLRTPLQGQSIDSKHTRSAAVYIPATPSMKPHERIEIYNQQYWWRLFSALQNVLPGCTELLGKSIFNQKIAEPYFVAHEPKSWSLYRISDAVIAWLEKNWKGDPLLLKLAHIDFAFYSLFLKEVSEVPLDPERPFYLQPHVKLVDLEEDMLTYRQELLTKKTPQTPPKKRLLAVLFRIPLSGKTYWQDLEEGDYALLKAFERGATLEEALDGIDAIPDIAASFAFFSNSRLITNEPS